MSKVITTKPTTADNQEVQPRSKITIEFYDGACIVRPSGNYTINDLVNAKISIKNLIDDEVAEEISYPVEESSVLEILSTKRREISSKVKVGLSHVLSSAAIYAEKLANNLDESNADEYDDVVDQN